MSTTDLLAKIIHFSGINLVLMPFRKIIKKNEVVLLGYHRIATKKLEDGLFNHNLISCRPEQFESELKFLKKNFDILTFKDLPEMGLLSGKYRFAIVTFDDGYVDNYTNAFPVLRACGVPAVFFVVPGIIEGKTQPWWEMLSYFNKAELIPHFLQMSPIQMREELTNLQAITGRNELFSDYFLDKFMNWEQIKEISDTGMEIGCHTYSHYILAKCSWAEKLEEIGKAKIQIETKTGTPVISLAYPVGTGLTYDDECALAATELGIKYAVTYNDSCEYFPFHDKYKINRLQSEYYDEFHHFCARIALPEIIRW